MISQAPEKACPPTSLCRVRLAENHQGAGCAYPTIEVLPGGTFIAITYGHWTPGAEPYILSVRFTMGQLDRIRQASSN